MKAKLSLFSLAIVGLMSLLNGCDVITCVEPKVDPNETQKVYRQFIGEWQWDKTYYGWGGWKTPAQMGYSETISFGSDNIYRKYRNGVVITESPYTIAKIKSAEPGRDSVFVYYLSKANTGQPLFLIKDDTLHTRISEVCNDCAEEYYVRKKVNQPN